MTPPPAAPDVAALVDEFIRQLHAGESPDPDALVLAHPRHAAELEEQLHTALRVYREVQSLPRIGRYRLTAQIGAGGSAVVYRAIDTSTHRTVALKVFRPACRTDRFEQDARLLLKLKHPHIARFLDAGIAEGRPYIALELIEGGSLAARLSSGVRYAPAEAARLVRKLAGAIEYAHGQGVIHRDLKPGNVLIDAAGEPQLIDFGLARDLTVPGLTQSGDVLGTPQYMAPEQVRGGSNRAGAPTDVYALGAVLYELLTGRPPFAATDPVELARRITEEAPARPARIDPEVPPTLEAVCLRCLEKEPADRFPAAAELARALQLWEEGQSQRVWLPSRAGRVRRWWRRQKPWVRRTVLAAGLLVVACGVLGWSAWTYRVQADADRREAALAAESAELDRRAAALVQEQLVQESLIRARSEVRGALARGWRALQQGRMGRLAEVGESLAVVGRSWGELPPREQNPARFEARALFAMALAAHDVETTPPAVFRLPGGYPNFWAAAVHPDGGWLALGTRTRPLRLDVGSQLPPDEVQAPALGEPRPRLAFDPAGRWLAFSAASGFQIWDGELRRPRPLADLEPATGVVALDLAFTPDGAELRGCFSDGTVKRWRTRDWAKVGGWALPPAFEPPTAARFSPSGNRLAVGNARGRIAILDESGPAPGPPPPDVRSGVQAVAWGPDELTLAAGFGEGRVLVWDPDGRVRELTGQFTSGVESLEYSPDGGVLCAGRTHREGVVWDAAGKPLLTGPFAVAGFSRDGRSVALAAAQKVGLGRWVAPGAIRTLRGHRAAVGKLACSADGSRLATLDTSYECRVWDPADGRPAATFPLPAGGFYPANSGLALSGDGRLLAYASGGREKSWVLVRDLGTGRVAGPWELPGAFEYLAAVGGDRFRLVREEFVPYSEVVQSVLYELDATHGPRRVGVIRPARPGDTRRYFEGLLTEDGRYYFWCGPREPRSAARVAVADLDDRRVIFERPLPLPPVGDPGLEPDPGRRGVLLHAPDPTLFRLPTGSRPLTREEVAVSTQRERPLLHDWPRLLRQGLVSFDGEPQIGMTAGTFVPEEAIEVVFPFPDDRRFAWSDRNGVVLVADLEALSRAVTDFERRTFR
jgi:WD40 repeat protein